MRHESSPQQNNEAVFAGLPTRKEVNQGIRNIHAPINFGEGKSQRFGLESLRVPRFSIQEFSPAEYEQYQREFIEDVNDFGVRIQRLKIRTLSHYLAGYWKDPGAKTDAEKEKTTVGKIYTMLGKLKYNKRTVPDQGILFSLQEKINQNLPEEYRLAVPFSPADIDLLDKMARGLLWNSPPPNKEKKDLETILSDTQEIEKALASLLYQGELFPRDPEGYVGEQSTKKMWLAYRRLLKQIAGFEELGSWYSPTYQSAGEGQKGRKQHSIPFRTDYQRFRYEEIERLESLLGNNYFGDQDALEIRVVLFNGGLNALEGIYTLIDRGLFPIKEVSLDSRKEPKIFKTKDIYFEVDGSLNTHFINYGIVPEEFSGTEIDQLIQRIKSDLPHAVFLSPMSNMFEMKVTEIIRLLDALTDPEWKDSARKRLESEGPPTRDIYIVIDNSSVGRLALWRNYAFYKLPNFVKVIGFESLIKYAQDGQELAQAALVMSPRSFIANDLVSLRGRIGSTPPENTIRRLAAAVPADLTDKKMMRHSRNSLLFAEKVETGRENIESGLVGGVVYPAMPSHPQHEAAARELAAGGGLLNIQLDFNFLPGYREIFGKQKKDIFGPEKVYEDTPVKGTMIEDTALKIASAFIKFIFTLAKKAGVELNEGTSYGFHTTRVAIYKRDLLPGEKHQGFREHSQLPYIRVATGTETNKNVSLIAETVSRANEVFSQAIRERRVITLSDMILERDDTKTKK